MTFSGKTCLIDNIKSHKKVGFLSLSVSLSLFLSLCVSLSLSLSLSFCLTVSLSLSLSLENKFLEKTHGGGGGFSKIDPHQA